MRRLDAAGPPLDRAAVATAVATALTTPGPKEVGALVDALGLAGEARDRVLAAGAAVAEGGGGTPRARGSRLRSVARAPVALVKGAAGLVKGGPTPAPPPKPGATFTAAWADFLEVAGTAGDGMAWEGGGGSSGNGHPHPPPVLPMAPVPPAAVLPPPPSLAPVAVTGGGGGGVGGEIQPAGA